MLGLALSNNPPYEFDIKPNKNNQIQINDRNTEMDGSSEIDQIVTIKIKIKSKKNPNYIKLVGMAEIKMSQLISGANTNSWFKLYSMVGGQRGREEVISKDPIGKIHLESNFFENSSVEDEEESPSENDSFHNSEMLFAKKIADAGKGEIKIKEQAIWNPGYIKKG